MLYVINRTQLYLRSRVVSMSRVSYIKQRSVYKFIAHIYIYTFRVQRTYVHLGMCSFVSVFMLVHRGSRHRRLRNTSSKQFVVGHERRYHVLVRRRSVALRPPPAVAGIIGQVDFIPNRSSRITFTLNIVRDNRGPSPCVRRHFKLYLLAINRSIAICAIMGC